VRGFGSVRIKLHRPNPLNLSFSPLGEKGRSVHAATAPHRAKGRIREPTYLAAQPERPKKLIMRIALWRDTLEKGTVKIQTSFGYFRRLGAIDDGAFGRP
jgi:hypothetical protein